jgi:hypothetical protein
MMKKIILYIAVIFIINPIFSQIHPEHKRANNWFFGEDESGYGCVHLNFNSGTMDVGFAPIPGAAGYSQTSISDTAGNFMFFYNGFFIINKDYALVEGGEEIYGHEWAPLGAMFLPVPENDSLILLLYSSCWDNNFSGGLRYAIVNALANNGLGKVISYDNHLLTGSTGSVTAAYHNNGIDFWIVAADTSSYLHSYYIDNSGIPQHVDSFGITTVSTLFGSPIGTIISVFTTKPEANLIAVSSIDYEDGLMTDFTLSLIGFNSETGVFDNEILIESNEGELINGDYYSGILSFSPQGDYLYVSFVENPLPRNGYVKRYSNFYNASSSVDIVSEIVFETYTHQAPYTVHHTPIGTMVYYALPGDDNPGSGNTPYFSEILYPDSTSPVVLHNSISTDVYFTLSPNNNLPPAWYYRPEGFSSSKEKIETEKLIIGPNPARDELYILNGFTEIEQLSFIDISGKEFFAKIQNNSRINVEKLNNGIYLLKIRFKNGLYKTTKVIIQH